MSKFQEKYTIAQQSFEDFKKIAPNQVKYRPNVDKALLSDSEIIAIALCGEIFSVDSENAWYSFVKKNYRHLFPRMCDRSQFNRTRRNLLHVMDLIFTQVAKQFVYNIFIVDSFPLEMCKFGRDHFCKVFRADGAAYNRNPSKKQTYFGNVGVLKPLSLNCPNN